MLVKNDKIRLVKKIGILEDIGQEFTVVDIDGVVISFSAKNTMGCGIGMITYDEFKNHFEKVEEKKIPIEDDFKISKKEYDYLLEKTRVYENFIREMEDITDKHYEAIYVLNSKYNWKSL